MRSLSSWRLYNNKYRLIATSVISDFFCPKKGWSLLTGVDLKTSIPQEKFPFPVSRVYKDWAGCVCQLHTSAFYGWHNLPVSFLFYSFWSCTNVPLLFSLNHRCFFIGLVNFSSPDLQRMRICTSKYPTSITITMLLQLFFFYRTTPFFWILLLLSSVSFVWFYGIARILCCTPVSLYSLFILFIRHAPPSPYSHQTIFTSSYISIRLFFSVSLSIRSHHNWINPCRPWTSVQQRFTSFKWLCFIRSY